MEIILMNMCMIYQPITNQVLVLDKVKKEGWEGLTFPGGHIEKQESFYDSTIREVYEETGLKVKKLQLKGFKEWYMSDSGVRYVGILYYTEHFFGTLIHQSKEGKVFWMNLDDFLQSKDKSDAMDDCMKVFLRGGTSEIISYWEKEKKEVQIFGEDHD